MARLLRFGAVLLCTPALVHAFHGVQPAQSFYRPKFRFHTPLKASTASTTTVADRAVATLPKKIDDCIAAGGDPEALLCSLEALNTVNEPNRSPDFLGESGNALTDT